MDSPDSEIDNDLSIINHPATRLPGPELLHSLVQKDSQDQLPAIDFLAQDDTRTTLSYTEFHHASDVLANRILALAEPLTNSKPFIVPVLIPQSPGLYIALLAILKASGAFCPLNLDVPLERARLILEDVSATVVITTAELASKLPEGDHAVLIIEERPDAPETTLQKPRRPGPNDLAYVMYTSGSTGTPKGVAISHDAVTQSLLAHNRHIPEFSRFLQFAAPTFDVSVFEIFLPLFRGKTLVSCSRSAMLNDLPAVIQKMAVDACELTPSVAGSLLRKREHAPGLRLLLTIGEMLTEPVIQEFGGTEEQPSMLWGMYGPTEAAIHCTLQPAFCHTDTVGNIGIPLNTVSAFILPMPDEEPEPQSNPQPNKLTPLPLGSHGELAIGGHQLATGYLNRPELTASVFIDTPYGRLYRTGDKARMLPDGKIECLGRIGHGQVKLRGQRIELGEVEHAALRTRGCHSAVAAVVSGGLVLFCAVDGGLGGDIVGEARKSCREWLPGYMMPGDVVVVESFPRLPSGKVDRKGLIAGYEARQAEGAAPQGVRYKDEFEERLCEIVGRSLGVEVGPGQELAKAGLDSLSAIKLASVLRDAGFNVAALDVLGARTVSSLRSHLGDLEGAETGALRSALEVTDLFELDVSSIKANHTTLSTFAESVDAIIPCTPLQAAMLAETMADPRTYCNWVELSVPGSYSEETIRTWFLQLVQANEILRTGFILYRGEFLQVIFEKVSESQCTTTDSVLRDFQMQEEKDFLVPFRVQISPSPNSSDTTVVIQVHHAVYDGWSLDLMLTDLERFAREEESEPRPQFRNVSAYYQSEAFKNDCNAAREFWAGALHGFQPPPLPVLNPELMEQSTILSYSVTLDIIPEDLRIALQHIDCGPQTLFQAALSWLWSSILGTKDVVVGSVTSGRTVPVSKIEDVVGPCIATVPLRTNLSQVKTVRDLLISMHAGNRTTLLHSILPLSEIKRAAGIRSGQAIYDVLFIYQETLLEKGESMDIIRKVAQWDYLETKLLVEIEPGESDFKCRFTYHSNVFPRAQVDTLAELLWVLAHHMLDNLNSEVSSMRGAFPHKLLSIVNPEPKTFTGVPDLAQAVEAVAVRVPEKDAVCFADCISDGVITTTSITFAELNKTASQIAWHLRQQGLGDGAVVAIIMEKSIRFYAGVLAILKVGCAYLPLLPTIPVARIGTIIQQAKAEFCLVDSSALNKLENQLSCTFVDIQSLDLRSTPTAVVRAKPDPNRLAYIIYTSGSTGVPKGVCITQLNIMSNLDVLSRLYPVKDDSRLLQSCSQAFDVSVFEIFFAWAQGMCLCSGTNDTLFDDLERSIRKLNVTHLSMTPTVASLVDPEKVPRVEFLVTSGEAMTEIVARKWRDKLYQGYGPSETTNICSVKKMGPNQAIRHLGWAFENTSAFVLATDGIEVLPLGCLGELCFGGDQVAQGYLDQDDLTSANFTNHATFGRIYRSGDLGRMLPDGSLVIIGRADEQIKLRGQRVELNEITETIRQSSAKVADCTTLFLQGGEDDSKDKIVSYMVPNGHGKSRFEILDVDDELKLSIRSVYDTLFSILPAYMIPSTVVPISALPTTLSGKLDRERLKHTFKDLDTDILASCSPGAEHDLEDGQWSDTEIQVAEAVSAALEVDRADIKRWIPLTTLGLDSLSAIRVSKQLQTTFGARVPISSILQNASIARLSQALSCTDTTPAVQLAVSEEVVPELLPKHLVDKIEERLRRQGKQFTKILPCTPLQEAMLATSANNQQYLNRIIFRVHGDLTKLRESWDAMCIRHDILRTSFVTTDDSRWPILQAVLDQWQAPWYELDGSQSTVDACISQHASKVPNALDTMEPAVSFAIISRDDASYLSFVCHHALYDGTAIEMLFNEVEQHFAGSSLPNTPDYEEFLRASLVLPETADNFWQRHLADYEPKLTTYLTSDTSDTRHGALISELDIPLSHIQIKTRELGVSLLALTQSAWAVTLGVLFRSDDICFGNVVNGRSIQVEGVNELVAPCFNTIPIRMPLSSNQRNVDLMKAFQSINSELMDYQFTPLRRIQSLFSQHSNRRLFDTLLLLQQSPRPLNEAIWTLESDDGEMDVPLVCEVTPDPLIDRLVVKLHTIESQPLSHDIVALVRDLFSHVLRACLQFPASHVALENIPQGLASRLPQIQLPPPQTAATSTTELETSSEEWTATEGSIRTVLATFSSSDPRRIQRQTKIYQLGLDSISAVQIASALRKLGHPVLASHVIEHPTCESLARYLDTRPQDKHTVPQFELATFHLQVRRQIRRQGIAMHCVEAVLPCTPLQCAMMAQFLRSSRRDYFNYVNFELEHHLDAATMADAWRAVARAHPMLRTLLLPVEHSDWPFVMVQYLPHAFAPALSVFTDPEAFELGEWQLEAARAASGMGPEQKIWSVGLVQGVDGRMTMHLAIHHALYDAHSFQLILDDLSRAASGRQIFPVARTSDAVSDILSQIYSTAETSAKFWEDQADKAVINGFPVMTPLRQSFRELAVELSTSSVHTTVLEDAAAKSGHTLQVILQAAWTRVLSAYLGEDSVTFGVVFSGRNTETTQNAAFPCVTTLPVISTNSDSNKTLLGDMLRNNTELYKQQHQPLTRIQQWLGRPDSRLFDTLLVYQKLDLGTSETRPWRMVDDNASVDYPVSIEVEPQPDGLLGYRVTFFSDVLAKGQALMLLKQFDAQVQHLALNPNGHDADLFKFTPGLFSVLPPETPEIPTTVKFLHQFVEIQAIEAPGFTALHFVERFDGDLPVGRKWTYKELNDNGNRVAQTLLPRVNPGDIVAVYFDKCPAAYFSILGILKAGCAFVALDPGAPQARNEFIISDSGASVVLTSSEGKAALGTAVSVPILVIDESSLSSITHNSPTLQRPVDPNDVCYCLYTSGTTGTPKGCEITHDNTVQCMLAFQHIFQGHWQPDSKWLQFASLHFDVSVLEQYWSWSVGITLVAAPRDLILEDLAGTISRLEITHIDLTPSLARLLHPDDVPSLCKGVFITGGESLKQEILDVWGKNRVIYNFYGPTEATIGVTVYPRVPTTGRASNIGRQFINVGSYVLKPGTEQPVLRGAVGELCVSGRLVGKGYLHREDLTADKFPTLQQFGERVYRTGDLVRVLHDGSFDFLGRADDQVKLRGQRLEIGEINHAIRKGVAMVKDVATLVVRNETQKKDLLVSFIVADDDGNRRLTTSSLKLVETPEAVDLRRRVRNACRSKLPGYMVPTYVLQLSFIPLSANNKAEIKELRKFFASIDQDKLVSLSSSADKSLRGLDSTARTIAKVLGGMQELDQDSITAESSIFELGIDSISVLRFSRALKNEGLKQASPAVILRHHLIGDLSDALREHTTNFGLERVARARQLVHACAHKHRSRVCKDLGVKADQIEYIAPCSPLQQGMISKSASDSAYFNTFRFIIAPGTSIENLRLALGKAVEDLAILRTKFVATTEGFIQVALKAKDSFLPWTQLKLDGKAPTEAVIQELREAWVARNQGNLIQPVEAVLVDKGDGGDQLLILQIFHGLYDASSFQLILDRLVADYLALNTGKTSSHEQEVKSGSGPSFLDALCYGPLQDFSSSKLFWEEHLHGVIPVLTSAHSQNAAAKTQQIEVSFRPLDKLRASLGVTQQALVQAAWVSVLAKHLSTDPTIGIIVSGRSIELDGAGRIVGPLFNTLPFHARTPRETSWSSLIRQCHDFNTATLAFQHTPLRDIQKWCSRGKPLFDTLLSFQREDGSASKDNGPWTVVDSESNPDYPLALEAVLDSDHSLRLLLVAQDHDPAKLPKMMGELEQALRAMAENPAGHISHSGPGVVKPAQPVITNGHMVREAHSNQPAISQFSWTEEAVLIRNEIALLTETFPECISEGVPLFGMGLDSIDVIKLSARLNKSGIKIKTSELMKAQTIRAMAELLQTQSRDAKANGIKKDFATREMADTMSALREYVVGLGELGDGDIVLPTTALQESMMVGMIESDFQLYFNHDIIELAPSVNIHKFKDAWKAVIAGSPILRTRFIPVDSPSSKSVYCQVIGTDLPCYIADVTLDKRDELTKICDSASLRARKAAGRTDLLQLVFATVGDKEHFLVLSIAHALYDGWSLALIRQHVQAAYEGRYHPPSLDSYLSHLHDVLLPSYFNTNPDAASFWSDFLQDATPTLLPEISFPSPSLTQNDKPITHRITHRITHPSAHPAPTLTCFCTHRAITTQILGQACMAALLASLTGSLDVTFGVVLSCRDTEALEELVFPTMNTVAVRSVLHGTVGAWVEYMGENMVGVGEFGGVGLREVMGLVGAKGRLFNALFIQQVGMGGQKGGREGEVLGRSVGGEAAVEYPFGVEMEIGEEGLVWTVACDGGYASYEETVGMVERLDKVLGYIVGSPAKDVLVFDGDEVSVCGLPPVRLNNTEEPATSHTNGEEMDGTDVWTPLEETIRNVLAEVSGISPETILRSNSIYHLGLDSISVIKASSLMRRRGIPLGLRDILKAGSIVKMARLVENAPLSQTVASQASSPASFKIPEEIDVPAILRQQGIDDSIVEGVLPALPMQIHMLSVWENTRGEVFHPEFRYTLSGPVDLDIVNAAWEALVTELPILRTLFLSTASRSIPVLQVVVRPSSLHKSKVSDDSNTWDSKTTGALSQPYSHMHIEKDGEGKWALRLKIHHALYDAVSLPAIMDRFAALCSGAIPQGQDTLAFNWGSILTPRFSDDNRGAREQFWREYLTGAEPLPLNLTSDDQASKTRVSLVNRHALEGVSNIMERCKAGGVSIQALFFAAYAEFLACVAVTEGKKRPNSIVFGIYLANRTETNEPGADVYPFLRLVPIRVAFKDEASLMGIAAEVQRDIHTISSPVNAEVGLWEIKDWTGITVDSFVNFLGAPVLRGAQGDVRLELAEDQGVTSSDEESGETKEVGLGFAGNPVLDAFPDAIDVEVALQGDDMTIGVFGSEQKLGGSGAERIIEGVVELLKCVV